MRQIEREVMLRVIDAHWVPHITGMENLRQGIGLYAYGQRDPLVMYKKEGHEMFQNLQGRIRHDIVHTIFHLGMDQNARPTDGRRGGRARIAAKSASPMSRVVGKHGKEAVAAGNRKIGRNEPCHCGSGKKYKKCHGA